MRSDKCVLQETSQISFLLRRILNNNIYYTIIYTINSCLFYFDLFHVVHVHKCTYVGRGHLAKFCWRLTASKVPVFKVIWYTQTLRITDALCWTWDQKQNRGLHFWRRYTPVDRDGRPISHFLLRQIRWLKFLLHKLCPLELQYTPFPAYGVFAHTIWSGMPLIRMFYFDFSISFSNRTTSLNTWNLYLGSSMVDSGILLNTMKFLSRMRNSILELDNIQWHLHRWNFKPIYDISIGLGLSTNYESFQ